MHNLNLEKNIQLKAKNVLLIESEALAGIADKIDGKFSELVFAILRSKGRLVISGVGKSAIVAQKITATLNSTGSPALFMHAADAIHGDLGMIRDDDMVLLISKSGNTSEIKVLIPLIKRLGNEIIALTSNISSYLAKEANFVMNATINKEACPHNLAPTTSTTSHMALGDALAVALIEARGFSSQDFARYHPGGSLGKQLYLKVDQIYPANELPIVASNTTIKDVILEISEKRLGMSIVTESEKMIGIITDGDLRRMLQKTSRIDQVTAKEIMTTNPKTISHEAYAAEAMRIMKDNNITQLVVVKSDRPVGVVHMHDLLKEGLI